MRRLIGGLLLAWALTPLSVATAQTSPQHTFQNWSALLGTASLESAPPRFRLWLDTHARRGDGNTVVIIRPALGYQLTSWLTLWGGYAWVPTFKDGPDSTSHEHRIWQQVTLAHAYDIGLSVQSRTRFEQRFSDQGDDVALRLREFVRVNYRPSKANPVGIAVWDELFVGLTENDWSAPQGFDQNRIFIGPFLQMQKWARFEAGYLFVHLRRGGRGLSQHVFALNLFYSL